jgi:alkylation response protein AidB-like acyl-CoA dehydrogenase
MNVLRPAYAEAEALPAAAKPECETTVHNGVWGTARSRRYDDLAAPFRPIFRRIQEGAIQRERDRLLPFEQIQWLKDMGFGAVRPPKEFGGWSATLPGLFALLTELAEADSNLTHALRVHFAYAEDVLNSQEKASLPI